MMFKNKYRIGTFIAAIVICLVVMHLHLISHEKTQEIFTEQTVKTIIEEKKEFLKDTINNMIVEIDRLREAKQISYKRNTESRLRRFKEELHHTDKEFIAFYSDRFIEDLNPKMWTAILWNEKTKQVYYHTPELKIDSIENTISSLQETLSSFAFIDKGDIRGMFGVSDIYIEDIVKSEIADLIRSRKFSNDSYIWVNEVVNYSGGDNYAIRRVHPNLPDTEGLLLSTSIEDVKGNLPYLEELEGIKLHGEVFLNYYFKKLDSNEVSEKISFAKLYKDYNWILSMGVHVDDIDVYISEINSEIDSLASETVISLMQYILIVMLIGFSVLFIIEKKHILSSTKYLQNQMNMDGLTKACSRRCGEANLETLFKQFQHTGERPAIMMVDIDDFKHINDSYGHNIGDLALVEMTQAIQRLIRTSDHLIRWGGDEFVGIFPGLPEDHVTNFATTLLDGVSSLQLFVGDENISITISIGFSYFQDTDKNYLDVLKRADNALYQSKQQGKNQVHLIL